MKRLPVVTHVLAGLSVVLLTVAWGWGLWFTPADYQQQDAYRIIHCHVPAAFASMAILSMMGLCALGYIVFKLKALSCLIQAAWPVGLLMTVIALWTGAIWGKPMWGAYWVWDARLTSELILAFIYLSFGCLNQVIKGQPNGPMILAIWTLIATIDLPIIHYSVNWWHTLHQGQTLKLTGPSLVHSSMIMPLWIAIAGFFVLTWALICQRLQTTIMASEAQKQWLNGHLMD